MPQFKFVNIKCIQRRISELFRDKVVQNFVEICGFEICRSKKKLRQSLCTAATEATVFIGQLEDSWLENHIYGHTPSLRIWFIFYFTRKNCIAYR